MASHGFWSLGGDNARANTGSQSPSTREWLFCLQISSDAGAALLPAHCLNPARCVWCYSRRVKIQTGLLCLYSTHLFLHLFFSFLQDVRIWSKGLFYYNLHGASVLQLGRTWSLFILIWFIPLLFQPELGAKRRPRNFPEELDRNYMVCWRRECVAQRGGGWGRYFGDVSFYFYPGPVDRVIKQKYLNPLMFCGVQSAAQCRGSGETRRSGRQAAATGRSCRHLRLQQILQLHQSCCGLLRPLFNRY